MLAARETNDGMAGFVVDQLLRSMTIIGDMDLKADGIDRAINAVIIIGRLNSLEKYQFLQPRAAIHGMRTVPRDSAFPAASKENIRAAG